MAFRNPDPRTYERAPLFEETGIVIVHRRHGSVIVHRRHGSVCVIRKDKALRLRIFSY